MCGAEGTGFDFGLVEGGLGCGVLWNSIMWVGVGLRSHQGSGENPVDCIRVRVGVRIGVRVKVWIMVGVRVGVRIGVGVRIWVGVRIGVGVRVRVRVRVRIGVGVVFNYRVVRIKVI